MDISTLKGLSEAVGVPVYSGYAATGAAPPYIVLRPMTVIPETTALCGQAIDWDVNHAAYCCAASVEASFNLATALMGTLQGSHGLSTSLGYTGAQVEGNYETQVTIQLNQGGL